MVTLDPGPPTRQSRRQDAGDLARLLALSASGDTDAFMRFYDLTSPVVYRYVRLVSPDRAAVDDLARDIFLRAWATAASQAASGLSPLAWLLA